MHRSQNHGYLSGDWQEAGYLPEFMHRAELKRGKTKDKDRQDGIPGLERLTYWAELQKNDPGTKKQGRR